MNHVYTYFNEVNGLQDPDMIELWEESWRSRGWYPIILNEHDARHADPDVYKLINESPLMETRNPTEYGRATMLRWVAMLSRSIKSPCLHVDWDVICNSTDLHDFGWPGFRSGIPNFLSNSTCPCAIAADSAGWRSLVTSLLLAPHLTKFSREALLADSCDQYGTSILPPTVYSIYPEHLCKLYTEEAGWEVAPMIHFPNRLTQYPRSNTIRKVLS